MERRYTLKEAAQLLCLTKPGLRFRLASMGEKIEKDEKGHVVVSESVLQRVRTESRSESEPESGKQFPESKPESEPILSEKPESEPESKAESDRKAESEPLASMLSVLREQLAVKDAQIAQLTAQLSDTTAALKSAQKALEGAQALHAATVKQLQEATREDEPEAEDESPDPAERKGGFFGWLRRGK